MTSDDVDVLVCRPVKMDRSLQRLLTVKGALPLVPGSIRSVCELCGVEVYIAPRGQLLRDAGAVQVACLSCVADLPMQRSWGEFAAWVADPAHWCDVLCPHDFVCVLAISHRGTHSFPCDDCE